MSSPSPSRNAAAARQRTYTTVQPPAHLRAGAVLLGTTQPVDGGGALAAQSGGAAPVPPPVMLRKAGIHPEPISDTPPCSCDPSYLQSRFCLPGGPAMNFHERFYCCSACGMRPAAHVCCKCWKGFCKKHASEHFATMPEHHVMANYELWQYEECFWCFKCKGFAMCSAFDPVLEPLFMSKGSFMPQPITEKHSEAFGDTTLRVGAGTMQGWRADNEDSHVIQLGLPHSGLDLFAVYDGHGGPLVARFAGKRTHEIFDNLWRAGSTDVVQNLIKCFMMTDEALSRETSFDESGSTGCTANVVVLDRKGGKVYCANAGDARSVLSRGGKAINLSEDQRPDVESERRRIVEAGSTVSEDYRVEGLLAVSRAIGDFDFKQASSLSPEKQAVTCCPEVSVTPLTSQDEFIVVACDGIWDCMTSQQVVSFVAAELPKCDGDPRKVCVRLLDKCVAREIPEDGIGTDNMSVILVLLK